MKLLTYDQFTARYKFDRKTDVLGKGGFGTVYKAYDDFRNAYVAIKIAEVDHDNQKFRLLNEFQRAKSLPPHANIAHYEECFTFTFPNAEYDYALMQYYETGNLQQLLEKNELSVSDKISLLKDILNGIELLHKNNIIHRDLKPENILIAQRPNGSFVPKIADFGISKVMDVDKTVGTNTVMGGTFSYSSPEQLAGKEIRKNADLWSYGILVCEIFTGRTPFNSGGGSRLSEQDRAAAINNILTAKIHSDFYNIPSPFNKVVELCLEKVASKRVKDASELKSYLGNNIIPITPVLSQENTANETSRLVNEHSMVEVVLSKSNNTTASRKIKPKGSVTTKNEKVFTNRAKKNKTSIENLQPQTVKYSDSTDLRELLKHELKDLHSAEIQIIVGLPKMIDKAKNPKLQKALSDHLIVAREQKLRLEKIQEIPEIVNDTKKEGSGFFANLFKNKESEQHRKAIGASGGFFANLFKSNQDEQHCEAVEGWFKEAQRMMEEDMETDVMDAALIAAAQKIVHYEIGSYGTARAYAEQLGMIEVEGLLRQTLDEEYFADNMLTKIALERLRL